MKCICDSGLSQIHKSKKCSNYLQRVTELLPIERLDETGKANTLDLSTTPVPESVFQDMFTETDIHKRLHVIYGIKNFTQEVSDPQTQDWNDGTSVKLWEGQLSITMVIPETSVSFIAGAESFGCKNPDVFLRTNTGQLVGYYDPNQINDDKKLKPLPVDKWDVTPSPFTTSEGVAQVEVTITFEMGNDYGKWIVLSPDDYVWDDTENYEPKEAHVNSSSTPTTTAWKVDVTLDSQGILGNSQELSGLDKTSFTVKNKTQGSAISLTSSTEAPAGTYKLKYSSSPSSGDMLSCQINGTEGYVSAVKVDTVP